MAHTELPLPHTRKQAFLAGIPHYFTGKPCIKGHVSKRHTKRGECFECEQQWKAENKDKMKEWKAAWTKRNYENEIARKREWAAANAERKKDLHREWRKRNHAKVIADANWRKARKKQATPPWADRRAIELIYIEARRITQDTGIPHVVDHEVPLVGENVCGLHIPENLRVITKKANSSKGNRFVG